MEIIVGKTSGFCYGVKNAVEGAEKELDKNIPVLVYCRSGRRSEMAGKVLSEKGYKVYDFGGIIDWPFDKIM